MSERVSPLHFLRCRAESFRQIAARYTELAEVCQQAEVTPLSGDLMSEEQWANNVNYLRPDYLPDSRNNSILLTMRTGEPQPGRGRDIPVAALRVDSSGLYCATLIGGNHDMSPGELLGTLRRIKSGPLIKIFGTWPGDETEEQIRQALAELS